MTRSLTLTALAVAACLSFAPTAVEAGPPQQKLLLQPSPQPITLPKFGFQSFNMHGVGERITLVNCYGLAAQIGLEPGDIITSLNGFKLTYHGAWDQALYNAVLQGGHVHLEILDVRTGHVAYRNVFVGGGVGPITPKSHYNAPVVEHHYSHPQPPVVTPKSGPITPKYQNFGPQNSSPGTQVKVNSKSLQQVSHLLKQLKN